jgi:hypothetical protein
MIEMSNFDVVLSGGAGVAADGATARMLESSTPNHSPSEMTLNSYAAITQKVLLHHHRQSQNLPQQLPQHLD